MPLIAAIDGVTTATLMDVSSVLTLPYRSILFREGDVAEHLFCVLNGYIRLYRLSKDGREADVRICGPGDTFNECLIFGADHYHYNAQAAESCTLARFELSHLRTMIEKEPQVAKAILKSLSRSLLSTMDSMANDRLQTAPQRVANYLIAQCPGGATSYSLRLPFQKSVLAGKLGLAPEALSRAFSSLRDAGVIVRGRIVQIKDIVALKRI
ncbi:Crp/Fnr family transcriptional regulator [Agrobacterium bohemicum]|uniref:Crp/Fnr family transcriptional regulator n=1 Tax=Agrobacterium bohemicum TaxID=2052828 RepID=A0A135P4G2_9HYPH|nr:Crp/Fnr family transcriptional regulator [Agrobacterium bohemicum]KXG86307.1 Crp/Fnr family transcriptional regulator [Agrobacterium bohemicum]